jgi:hypothetical protein
MWKPDFGQKSRVREGFQQALAVTGLDKEIEVLGLPHNTRVALERKRATHEKRNAGLPQDLEGQAVNMMRRIIPDTRCVHAPS